ncbi:MAG: DNA replication/repair protein RecF [Syntrophomonadaceae bacterium]|nr:DNA replication/repair protein RecF [Syntrophomonadaceae bacterium]
MKLSGLQVKNFRNIKHLELSPDHGLTVFSGENAQGKTNILESIFVLATGSSFRTNTDQDMINYDAQYYGLNSRHIYNDRKIDQNITYSAIDGKTRLINSKRANQIHPDRLRVVLFTPDDLFLVKGSPSKRRYFLDFLLKQLSNDYYHHMESYTKILKKRNLLLRKAQANSKAFAITNDLFIDSASLVIINRINMVNLLDEIAVSIHDKLSGGGELKLRYALSFPVESGKINLDIIKESMANKMKQINEQETKRQTTLLGPHRDDINLYLDNRLARQYASQGQQRNIAVSLKLAEIFAMKKVQGFYPVMLLDEVLSELDEKRQLRLMEYLNNTGFQSFLTTVRSDKLFDNTRSVYLVKQGQLLRKE